MKNLTISIAWLYSDLMSTYGDRGNIITLQKRLEWRGITASILPISVSDSEKKLKNADLIFMGGAQDREQSIVASDFQKGKDKILQELIENNTPGLYICGAYQFLGNYYRDANGNEIKGLGILDLFTVSSHNEPRLIGNTIMSSHLLPEGKQNIVGFENHGGRTYLGESVSPLGKIIKGFGNNGKDQGEGAVYKNTFGTYFHGPILPKNPHFADHLIGLALKKKYAEPISLSPLDDSIEIRAHDAIVRKLTGRV